MEQVYLDDCGPNVIVPFSPLSLIHSRRSLWPGIQLLATTHSWSIRIVIHTLLRLNHHCLSYHLIGYVGYEAAGWNNCELN